MVISLHNELTKIESLTRWQYIILNKTTEEFIYSGS